MPLGECDLRRFPFVNPSDSPYQAPHRQLSPGVGEENFARPGAAIAPALQDREMLHALDRTGGLGLWKCCQRGLDAGLHRLRLGVFGAGDRKFERPRDRATIDAE